MKNAIGSITLIQLSYFHQLALTRHFTEAARQLYITQPTLSASVKSLENELGVSLVYREGRRNVRLTKYGEEFDARVAPLLEQLREVIDDISSRGSGRERSLNVGTIPTIQCDFLPSVLRGYWDARGYDKGVHISVKFTNALIQGLKAQEFDVVFCSRVPEESALTFIPVLAKPLVAVVHKGGPYGDMKSLAIEQLAEIPFATYRENAPIGRETRALLDTCEAKLEPAIAFDDEFSLAGYVVASRDVLGLMLDTFEIEPFKGEVKVIPVEGVGDDWHPICMAYDARLLQGEGLRVFLQVVHDLVGQGASVSP